MGRCTLVFGVPGVGKTTACQSFVERHPEHLFISASTLLAKARQATGEELRTAYAEQIVANQGLLGEALGAFRAGRRSQPVLVDAHGVIDNDVTLVRVPTEAVRSLCPDRLILLEATPSEVLARRTSATRPRPIRRLDEIAAEIAAERAAVTDYAEALDLALAIGTVGPGFRLDSLLEPRG